MNLVFAGILLLKLSTSLVYTKPEGKAIQSSKYDSNFFSLDLWHKPEFHSINFLSIWIVSVTTTASKDSTMTTTTSITTTSMLTTIAIITTTSTPTTGLLDICNR